MTLRNWILGYALALFTITPAYSAVLETREYDGVVYALTDNDQILRFDLESGSELNAIELQNPAQHLAVSADKIILANGREVREVSLPDLTVSYVGGTPANVLAVSLAEDYIITAESDNQARLYSSEGVELYDRSVSTTQATFITSKISEKVAYRSSSQICTTAKGSSESLTMNCNYFSTNEYGVSNGDIPLGTSELLVGSGYLLNINERHVSSRIPSTNVIAATRLSGAIAVLSSTGVLTQFSEQGIETGQFTPSSQYNYLSSYGDQYVVLNITDSGFTSEYISPEIDIVPPVVVNTPPALPGNTSSIIPENILTTQAGKAIFYDSETEGLYIWDIMQNAFTAAYFMHSDAVNLTYDEYSDSVFSIHSDGYLRKIDLSQETPRVSALAYLPGSDWTELAVFIDKVEVRTAISWGKHLIDHSGDFLNIFTHQSYPMNASYWVTGESAYYQLYRNYLRKSIYDTDTETFVTTSNTSIGDSVAQTLSVLPELNSAVINNGKLINLETLSNSLTLSSDIYQAAYPAAQLITVASDKSGLQIWSAAGELTSFIHKGNPDDLRLVYDDTYLGVIHISSEGTVINRYNIASGGDIDEDTVSDFFDNCPSVPNTNQADQDNDYVGDACDNDVDGDDIPNDIETANGLDPLSNADRNTDKDNDGLPNAYEYLIGADISSESSAPFTGQFSIDFDDGQIPSSIVTQGGEWFLLEDYAYDVEGYDLRGPIAESGYPLPYIEFYANFDGTGDLRFSRTSDNSYGSSPILRIYIAGSEVTEQYRDGYRYIDGSDIPDGIQQVRIELQIPSYNYNDPDEQVIIDDIEYKTYVGPDRDDDGIPDDSDNCYSVQNPDQIDSDMDGRGDACDSYFDDWDEDGIPDVLDNCIWDYNPSQADSDNNGTGDACDYVYTDDADDDGITDLLDNCVWDYNPSQTDSDNDGTGDACEYVYTDDDADDDGVSNWIDNCPDIANYDQADSDIDYLGDACDDDIDGDGLKNDDEETLGRDPLISEGIWYDSDNDGVADFIELRMGSSISETDEFSGVDLRSYFPLGNMQSNYLSDYAGEYRINMEFIGDNRYKRWFNDDECYSIVEARPDGIYLTEQVCDEEEGEDIRWVFTDRLIMPAELTPGEPITIAYTYEQFEGDNLMGIYTNSHNLTLVGQGQQEFNGVTVNTIELMYDNEEDSAETYAEGLGFFSTQRIQLQSSQISSQEEWPSSGGSGGAFNLFWLLLASIGLLTRQRRAY
ncbi:thrombospondin type 3 repeat-containing protein [Thalassolituus maritimus]